MGNMRAACVLAGAAWLGGCHAILPTAKIVPYLRDALGPSWTLVPLPSASLFPGSVVQVQPSGPAAGGGIDLRWLGTLADCAVPPSAAAVASAPVAGMSAGTTVAVDASLGARLAGVSAEIGADASAKASLTISEAADTTLDYIAFQRWAADPVNAAALAQACGPILAQPGVYVVQEAFVISAGTFTFSTGAGGKINVAPPPGVPVQAGVDARTGQTGALSISRPIVFALKVLQPLPQGGFQMAGALAAPHAMVARSALRLGGTPVRSVTGLPGQ